MTSVNTNSSATTALRTLQQTNKALETTQNKISTGLKIGEAKDNAAYWSISTTLQSDNKSLSTVKDALALGSSTVDVAYQGLTKTKEVLDEIRAKLSLATQDGLDRTTIQSEISELQKQLVSIAGASTLSGENWLSVDSSSANYSATKKLVSSFSRSPTGSVSIGTVDVNTTSIALLDANEVVGKDGILDGLVNLKAANGKDLQIGGTNAVGGNTTESGLAGAVTTSATNGVFAGTAGVSTNATGAAATSPTAGSPASSSAGSAVSITVSQAGAKTGDKFTAIFDVNGTESKQTVTLTADAADASVLATALKGLFNGAFPSSGTNSLVVTGTSPVLTFTGAIGAANTLSLKDFFQEGSTTAPTSFATQSKGGQIETAALNTTTLYHADSGIVAGDKLIFKLKVGANEYTSGGVARGADVAALATALNQDTAFKAQFVASTSSGKLIITSRLTGPDAVVSLSSVSFTDSTNAAKAPASVAKTGLSNVISKAEAKTSTFASVTLDANDHIYFDIALNGAAAKTVAIDQALINKTLSTAVTPVTTGTIGTVDDYKLVLEAALTAAKVSGVSVVKDGTALVFKTDALGADAKIRISAVENSAGGDTISVASLDISDAKLTSLGATSKDDRTAIIRSYIDAVTLAMDKVTQGAATLGSVAKRIDLQNSFVDTLMDSIDKGVGSLIDADLSEESTRLQALQTKQQLGVQALSIANQSTQNILRLFQ